MSQASLLLHCTKTWLPASENWIADQVAVLEGFNQQVITCTQTSSSPSVPFGKPINFNYQSRFLNLKLPLLRYKLPIQGSLQEKLILLSHFGPQGFHTLSIPCFKRICRFYGFDLLKLPKADPAWVNRYQVLFQKLDFALVEGPAMKQKLVKMGMEPSKVKILPLGRDTHQIPHRTRQLEGGQIQVLLGGTFKEKKGIVYAIEALASHAELQPAKSFTVHLIGQSNPRDEASVHYEQQIKEALTSLPKNVAAKSHGFLDKKALYLLALNCHIALHPSVTANDGDCEGGYPVLLLDYMATGLPVISSYHDDIPSIIDDSCGRLCEERNVKQLSQVISEVLSPEALPLLSSGARAKAETMDWSLLKKEYISFFSPYIRQR